MNSFTERAVVPAGINEPGPGLKQATDLLARRMPRVAGAGSLRTYLGTAPGVGQTFAMLAEGRRRAQAGETVVVGWLEPDSRTARFPPACAASSPRSPSTR